MRAFIAFVSLASALALQAQPKRTILVITDAEGVAGVCRQELTANESPELRRLLTGETNAAVDGFFDGGADEVIVWDGHGGSATLSADTIHPRARLIMGGLGPTMLMERGFAAVAYVGQHARANTKAAVMAHSYSSLGIQKILMNGKPVGEIETIAALAGAFDTPAIFLSGDQAAAADLKAIVPEAETVAVKESLAYYACISMSATAAREAIRAGAARAMKNLSRVKPYKVTGPVTFEIEYTTRNTLAPRVAGDGELVDARTIRYRGKDFLEALNNWRMR
jgi:D-amino peptidase